MQRKKCAIWLILLLMVFFPGGCSEPAEEQPKKELPQEAALTVMTQNLRVGADDGAENDIFLRCDRFTALLEQYKPDLIGLQEYTDEWDFMLLDYLEQSDYEVVFEYRASGDREATPIMYNAKKLELISHSFWWLSDTPEVESPSWDDGDGKRCRIVTECIFKERESGIEFVHINTHLGLTAFSQDESANLLRDRVAENYADKPVFVTADFNFTEGSQSYINLTADDLLTNSFYLATEFGNVCGTFNGFEERASYDTVIDFVFVNGKVDTSYYGVLIEKPEGLFVSDHFAVLTKNTIRR
ncbi:MAG: endonuclease/exonuclease/phosphatase family protein [Clostridia bacterium]|nr:endonuclease/exonuclease/phosphatase family protein [Clostridia bacterium]